MAKLLEGTEYHGMATCAGHYVPSCGGDYAGAATVGLPEITSSSAHIHRQMGWGPVDARLGTIAGHHTGVSERVVLRVEAMAVKTIYPGYGPGVGH